VGGARTALFNWLYARRHGGVFVLRIEDTDVERSSSEMVDGILDGLRWLGLDWDEGPQKGGSYGPYFQSQRLARYQAVAAELVESGRAYYCYCSADRLREERARAEARGDAWKYDGTCLRHSEDSLAALEAAGVPRAIRFKVPEGRTVFNDCVHGRIEVDHASMEDFVIVRSDGHPTYHLSVVVDDLDMHITDVIRGDDHISNTPKHVLLFEALGVRPPRFAHVPLILGSDKKRLSKRHGATSIGEYRLAGYLPEAMVNFLALLGWSPGGDRELLSREELVNAFRLEGVGTSSAVFNPDKLDWMNSQYIAALALEELERTVEPLLRAAGLWPPPESAADRTWLDRLLELLRPRVKRLPDFVEQAKPLLASHVAYEEDAVRKHLTSPELRGHVHALTVALSEVTPFDAPHVEATVRATAANRGIKAGDLIHATRVALTGRTASPGLFEVIVLLGRERTLSRLRQLQAFLHNLA
jgi:glutamyl-tRNA synthetase